MDQLGETLLPLPDLDARVKVAVDLITSTHKNVSREQLRFAASTFYPKLKAADGYVPTSKYPGNVTLLRAKTSSDYGDNLGADYKLSEVRIVYSTYCTVYICTHTDSHRHGDAVVLGKQHERKGMKGTQCSLAYWQHV